MTDEQSNAAIEQSGSVVARLLEELGEKWGAVYICYRDEYDRHPYCVRNHTDEGLPVGQENKSAYADDLKTALKRAVEGDYVDYLERDYDA